VQRRLRRRRDKRTRSLYERNFPRNFYLLGKGACLKGKDPWKQKGSQREKKNLYAQMDALHSGGGSLFERKKIIGSRLPKLPYESSLVKEETIYFIRRDFFEGDSLSLSGEVHNRKEGKAERPDVEEVGYELEVKRT